MYHGERCTPGPPTPPLSSYPLLVLLILQKMIPHIYQVLNLPLLCHDCPTTNLLKEGPGSTSCTFLDPQQAELLGLDNFEINTPPCPHKALQYLSGQCLLKGGTPLHKPVPTR